MQLHDGGDEAEAKTDARRISNLVGAVKSPQHGFALLFADAGPAIVHAHDGLVSAAAQPYVYPSALRRELDGVVDKVGDRFDQQVAIAAHGERMRRLDMQDD